MTWSVSSMDQALSGWLGVPYLYAGRSKAGVDCSGLTQALYQEVTGINIGSDTSQQLQTGTTVGQDGPQNFSSDLAQAQYGDLIFYGYPGASGPNAHVAMYLGNGTVAQAGGSDVNITPVFSSAAPDEPFLGIRRYGSFAGGPSTAGQALANANIPAWQNQVLDQLGSSGNLSGVSPQIMAAIDQAESSGQGGSINSAGYGGWFGLGAGHSYHAGTASSSLLQDTSQQSFQQQAEISSSLFGQLLQQYGGNPYRAEAAYQTGPGSGVTGGTEGDNVFQSLGIPATVTSSGPILTSTNISSSTSTYVAAGNAAGKVFQYIDGFLNPSVTVVPGWADIFGANAIVGEVASLVDRAIGIILGFSLVYIGVRSISGGGSHTTVNTLANVYSAGQDRKVRQQLEHRRNRRAGIVP